MPSGHPDLCDLLSYILILLGNLPDYERVVAVVGPNMYNAEGYLKWGIYKPVWEYEPNVTTFDTRTVWHDNVRIGFSMEDVDPSLG